MFKLTMEGFCEDKTLHKIHWALNGLLYDFKIEAQPVANAKGGKRGKVEDATNGNLIDVFRKYLKEQRVEVVTATIAKEFQTHIGRSPLGYSHLLTKACKEGLLRKTGKGQRTGYRVLAEGKSNAK